jgi:hypothetical protein
MRFKRTGLRAGMPFVPRSLKSHLLRTGGVNPFGEPLFRVVRADFRTIRCAGEWAIWAENLSTDERGSLGISAAMKMATKGRPVPEIMEFLGATMKVTPEHVIRGFVDRPKYGLTGWIVEKWQPAATWGSPVEWNMYHWEGKSALGPHPRWGDYEIVAGPSPYLPSISGVKQAIQQNFRDIDRRPMSAAIRLQQMIDAEANIAAEKQRDLVARLDAQVQDSPVTLCGNKLSLGARRIMNGLQEKIGVRSQYHA